MVGAADAALIRLSGVTRAYDTGRGNLVALRPTDLAIERGEMVAIVGPSGSGKSTILNVIAGIDRPSDGQIIVDNIEVTALSEERLTRWRGANVGIVFQFFQLMPTLSALENVQLASELRGGLGGGGKRRRRALELLDRVGLADLADHLPAELSGGEQQRVAIARALANRPRILLADEPTGNLDPRTSGGVFDALIAITRAEGLAALIATHNFELASRMDRALLLHQGKLIEGTQLPR